MTTLLTYQCSTEGCAIGDCPNCVYVDGLRTRLAYLEEALDLVTVARVRFAAPFTAADVAFCDRHLADWMDKIARAPQDWPTGGNEHVWSGALGMIEAHARGESAAFHRAICGVAISGGPSMDRACRDLLRHMLEATSEDALAAEALANGWPA